MKTFLLLFTGICFFYNCSFAQVSISADTSLPASCAMLEVKSTAKGFLPPRMTTTEMFSISNPVAGLMIYNTSDNYLAYYNGILWERTNGTAYSIPLGAHIGGGIVFYLDGTGIHGLIAAETDQGANIPWGCEGFSIHGAQGTAVGTGNANTLAIVTACTYLGIAAKICSDLVLNGYSDWFLPSKDELNLLYAQRTLVGGFANAIYWSSSEYSSITGQAWMQAFYNGDQYTGWKSDPFYFVRAIRAF
ncbi:MAG: DUF1566 domain-containing protein [Lentimicrobiaceae bacterium]|nr:DUF1566 domain-containing protein [Lentimicrobiaceae bacterium]